MAKKTDLASKYGLTKISDNNITNDTTGESLVKEEKANKLSPVVDNENIVNKKNENNNDAITISKLNSNKIQTELKNIKDSSNDKALETLTGIKNSIDNAKNSVVEPVKNWFIEHKTERDNEKYNKVIEEDKKIVSTITDDDKKLFYDDKNEAIDYDSKINDLEAQIKMIDANSKDVQISEDEIKSKKDTLQTQIDSYKDILNKRNAYEEVANVEALQEFGGEEALKSYKEQISHKKDSLLQRAGTAGEHLLVSTANIVPTLVDQMRETGNTSFANEQLNDLQNQYNEGKIDGTTYIEALDYWQNYINDYKSTNSDNISQKIRSVANQLSANTYYGASDVEKFVIQTGESTAQFLLHYLIGKGVAGGILSFEGLATREAVRELGGNIATSTMSLMSGSERMNQLLEEGYDLETSRANGLLTGLTSYITEKIGMDRFVKMLGTDVSADIIGELITKDLKSGLSEGLEEVVEGLVDPAIDRLTLGVPYQINGSELLMEFLIGGTSGLVTSGAANVMAIANQNASVNYLLNAQKSNREDTLANINRILNEELTINSEREKNLVTQEIEILQRNYETMTETQKNIANEIIDKGTRAIVNFESKSVVSGAVQFSSDLVEESNEILNDKSVIDALVPNFNKEVKFEKNLSDVEKQIQYDGSKVLQKARTAFDNVKKELKSRGYDIDVNVFLSLNEQQQKNALIAKDFANITGMKVDIVNNLQEGVSGQIEKGRIKIDGRRRPILSTLAHELTHGNELSSYYPLLKDIVKESYGDEWEKAVQNKIDAYKKITDLSVDEAEREVVARYVEKYLGDENFIRDLVKYNYSLASKIYQDIKSIARNDEVSNIKDAFKKAFNEVGNMSLVDKSNVLINNGMIKASDDSVAPTYSYDTWNQTDINKIKSDLLVLNYDKKSIDKWIKDVNSVASIVGNDKTRLDYVSNDNYSALKPNSDYKYTVDMSTLCKKRIVLQGTIDEIQRQLGNIPLTSDDYIQIRNMLKERGYEVSCGYCYVESQRRLISDRIGLPFVMKYNEEHGTNLKLYDVVTVDGIEKLQKTNPQAYNEFIKFNNKRGQQRGNLVQTRVAYKGEIMNLSDKAIANLIANGGLRIQSYSDFETPHLIDTMQVVIDMARRKLTAQAYTKVGNFVLAVGDTGIKVNLSLVADGVDANGKLIFNDVEGMNHKEAFKLRNKYSKNVGTVLVGLSDEIILAAMNDDRIDYIIPFHRSGWKKAELNELGIPENRKDYTRVQNEKYLLTGKSTKHNLLPIGNEKTKGYWDFNLSGKENAENYLKLCAENKIIPKFKNFLVDNGDGSWSLQPDGSTDGYWKTLIDFKMYDNDGIGSPQMPVLPNFSQENNKKILSEYDGGHRQNKFAKEVVNEFLKNRKYSYDDPELMTEETDNEGNYLSNGQVSYFDKSKLRDTLNRLVKIFHTSDKLFYVFNPVGSPGYKYGKFVVNFYSDNRDVSGSYTNGSYFDVNTKNDPMLEKAKIEEERKRLNEKLNDLNREIEDEVSELIKPIKNYSDSVDIKKQEESLDKIETYLIPFVWTDYISADERNVIKSFAVLSGGFSGNNYKYGLSALEKVKDNFNNIKNFESVFDKIPQEYRGLKYENLKNELSEIISKNETALEELFANCSKYLELKKQYNEDYNQYLDLENPRGFQYEGYGDVKNPYILDGNIEWIGKITGNAGNVSWNTIQNSTYQLDGDIIENIAKNLAESIGNIGVPEYLKYASDVFTHNDFILKNISEEGAQYLVENPIALASISETLKQRGFYDVADIESTIMDAFFNIPNIDDIQNTNNKNYVKTIASLETNDIVRAVISVNEYLKQIGESPKYDSVWFKDIYDSGLDTPGANVPSNIIATFNSNQFKLADNLAPTLNNDTRLSFDDDYYENDYYDYGAHPVRAIDILKENENGKVSKANATIANSPYVTKAQALEIQKEVNNGLRTYENQTNKQQRAIAQDMIKKFGFQESYNYAMNSNSIETAGVDTVFAKEVLGEMRRMKLGNTEEFKNLSARIAWRGSMLGQGVQAYSTFQSQTPSGKIITIESEVARLNEELRERFGDDRFIVQPNEELLAKYLKSLENGDIEGSDELVNEIAKDIAKQVPPTPLEQLNSYRNLSMLFNPRTWIKNKLSNTVMGYVNEGNRALRSVLESIAAKNPTLGIERQSGAYNPFNKNDVELFKHFKEEYYKTHKHVSTKYSKADSGDFLTGSQFKDLVSSYRKTFSWEFLNKINDINAKMMSDAPAMSNAYAKSMVGYFKVNNLTLDNVTNTQMQKADEFALNEALYATFNQNNKLANDINSFVKNGGKFRNVIVNSFIPFKRTPLNLISEGIDYSPIGLAKTLTVDLVKLKDNKITANQFIDNLATGLTGSALTALGAILYNFGIFRTKDDDKDRKQKFDRENGEQDYSLVFDGSTYTIDWLDPLIVPIAMGAEAVKYANEKDLSLSNIIDVAYSIADPMFETSMLSGIKNNLSSYSTGTTQWWGKIIENAMQNYAMQYLPSIGGATARTIDSTRRDTYSNEGTLKTLETQIKNKVPGLSMTNEPYINRSGKEEKNEDLNLGIVGRAVLNFVSPGYYSSNDVDKYDEELYRLYEETGSIDAFPSSSSKSFTYNKTKYEFTDKQSTEWDKVRWSTEKKYVDEFIDSKGYSQLSDEQKVETIKDIRSYAQEVAKDDYLTKSNISHEKSKALEAANNALKKNIELYEYFDYKNNSGTKQEEKVEYLEKSDLSSSQKQYLYGQENYKKTYAQVYANIMKKR